MMRGLFFIAVWNHDRSPLPTVLRCTDLHLCPALHRYVRSSFNQTEHPMKSLILWIAGVPLTVIIALKLFGVY
jgi:hypothetical protein